MASQDPETILRNLLNSIAEQQEYEDHQLAITTLNTGGANYTSKLFLVTITSKNKEDLKVFAKVTLMGATLRSQVPIRLFETEQFVYNELANVYETLQETNGVPEEHKYVFPKFYGCNDTKLQETVVLEDLTARGFQCHSRFESIDWNYASKAVEEMAKLHALSIAFAKEKPEQFQRVTDSYKFHPEEDMNHLKAFFNSMLAVAIKACSEENAKLLEKHYEGDNEAAFISMRRTLKKPVLVHADFRPSNLMHKVNDDGSMEMIVVDYQLLQAGSPVSDLLFFLMCGSDRAFREKHQNDLKEHYYNYLRESLKRLKLDPDAEYSDEDFEYEWKEMLPDALTMSIFSLPIITVNEEDAPVIDHNTDINGFHITRTSELFSKRMNEVIEDFKKWNILK